MALSDVKVNTGSRLSKFAKNDNVDIPTPPVKKKRKLWEGGGFDKILDALNLAPHSTASAFRALTKADEFDGSGFINRYVKNLEDPDVMWGRLLDEAYPGADESRLGRIATGAGGLVMDVASDVGIGAGAGKLAKAIELAPSLGKLGKYAAYPLKVIDNPFTPLKGTGAGIARVGRSGLLGRGIADTWQWWDEGKVISDGIRELIGESRITRGLINRSATKLEKEVGIEIEKQAKALAESQGITGRSGRKAVQAYTTKFREEFAKQTFEDPADAMMAATAAGRDAFEQEVASMQRNLKATGRRIRNAEKSMAFNRDAEDRALRGAKSFSDRIAVFRSRLTDLEFNRGMVVERLNGLTDRLFGRLEGKANTLHDLAANTVRRSLDISEKYRASLDTVTSLKGKVAEYESALKASVARLRASGATKEAIRDVRTSLQESIDNAKAELKRESENFRSLKVDYDKASKEFNDLARRIPDIPKDFVDNMAEYKRIDRELIRTKARMGMAESAVKRFTGDAQTYGARKMRAANTAANTLYPLRGQLETDLATGSPWRTLKQDAIRSNARNAGNVARTQGIQNLEAMGFDRKAANDLYDRVAAFEDGIGDRLVDLGVISKATADKWRGFHLRRIYQYFEDPEEALKFLEDFDPVEAMKLRSKKSLGTVNRKTGGSGIPSGVSIERKVLTDEHREMLNEIFDVGAKILGGADMAGRAVSRGELFRNIAKSGMAYTESQVKHVIGLSKRKYYQIPNTKTFGDIAGMYVDEHVFNVITRHINTADTFTLWRKTVASWKYGKAVLNVATHARNIMGNYARAWHEAGLDPARFTYFIGRGMKEIKEDGSYWNEFLENSPAAHDLFITKEFQAALRRYKPKYGLLGNIQKGWRAYNDWFGQLYSYEEEVGKLATYIYGREVLKLDPKAAGKLAADTLFDYGDVPYAVDVARKKGIVPFATYRAKAIPAELRNIVDHPRRYVTEWRGYGTIEDITRPDGMTTEDLREEKNTLPFYMPKGFSVRIGTDSNGESRYLDLTTISPVGQLGIDPTEPISGRGFADALGMTNPLYKMIAEQVLNKQLYNSRAITESTDPFIALKDRAQHISRSLLPTIWNEAAGLLPIEGTQGLGNMGKGLRGEIADDFGNTRLPGWDALGAIGGLRTTPTTIDKNYLKIVKQLEWASRDTTKEVNEAYKEYQQNKINDDQLEKRILSAFARLEAKHQAINVKLD